MDKLVDLCSSKLSLSEYIQIVHGFQTEPNIIPLQTFSVEIRVVILTMLVFLVLRHSKIEDMLKKIKATSKNKTVPVISKIKLSGETGE